ncbi:hypothetical protein [Bacillus cereus]|uniref:hypothetical protein n=1 Tax=Bacillus cereus TaxID=1396 RepID=UPI0002792604|nr:hypothetical protein [Bacillus cereus]EJQ34602.1 hypothetical protein IE9_00325 [Bacillus cereus BAG4X12-1]EOP79666.1 hypothetical protein IEG_04228 [Bacillus cereus BAG5X12-1]MEB9368478.1 hypothetical protein [Bacillus cereus]PER67350.1 hypothetical protein CN502_15845 [Bacillus cereus]PES43398.1 hypothetical protein CN515_33260 [Bacillus cereus]
MVQHIIDFAEDYKKALHSQPTISGLNRFHLIQVLNEELSPLNSKDFPPNLRGTFVTARKKVAMRVEDTLQAWSPKENIELADQIITCLSNYGFVGSLSSRNFSFIYDPDLKDIIERDYHDLETKLIPDKAWKSAVILAGSILEAILYDVFLNPNYNGKANRSPKAPKDESRNVKSLDNGQWTLEELIKVARDIQVLPHEHINTIDQGLRHFRNFVHPKKELRGKYQCGGSEALIAKGTLDRICDLFETTIIV